ncbi:MAG: hypothetical protein AB8H12_05840 [Lewinella sp.]
METLVIVLVNLLLLYTVIGIIFACIFLWKGAVKVDESVAGSSIWFKLLLFPGSCAFWPLLLAKWRKTS